MTGNSSPCADNISAIHTALPPEPVEDPDRHQLRPVGEPGEADPVVGLLGDRAGDVGAVAVLVERQAVLVDEVVARREAVGTVGRHHQHVPRVGAEHLLDGLEVTERWPRGVLHALEEPPRAVVVE